MTPREKAIELLNKMENPSQGVTLFKELRKSLALIVVDEVQWEIVKYAYNSQAIDNSNYWEQVKQEIINL